MNKKDIKKINASLMSSRNDAITLMRNLNNHIQEIASKNGKEFEKTMEIEFITQQTRLLIRESEVIYHLFRKNKISGKTFNKEINRIFSTQRSMFAQEKAGLIK